MCVGPVMGFCPDGNGYVDSQSLSMRTGRYIMLCARQNNSFLLVCINPIECIDNYSATLNNMKLVQWPLMDGLLHLVQREGDWAGPQPT